MGDEIGPGRDPDIDAVHSPDATADDLRRIAGSRPDLLARIAAHPNADPELLGWLARSPHPAIQAALARRRGAAGQPGSTSHNSSQHHVAAQSAGVPTSQQPRSPFRRRLLLGIGAGLVLILAATGGFFASRYFSGSAYDKAPSQKVAVDLADVGRNSQLTHLPARPKTDTDDQQLVRVVGPRQSVIVALHSKTLQPTWMAPVPHTDVKDPVSNDASGGDSEATSDDPTGDSSTNSDPELDGTPAECAWSTDAVVCGDRTIRLKDGEVSLSTGDDSSGDKTSSDPPDDTGTTAVADPATEAVPITTNGDGSLRSPSGATYPNVSVDPEATVRMVGAGEDGPWVVADGTAVIAVDSDSVLWKTELSEKAATSTSLGESRLQPNWMIEDDVLVIADDAGVHGLAVDTGNELWRVDADLDSFTVSDTHLMTMSDGVLEIFDFADPSDVDTVKADPGYSEGTDSGGIAKFPGADAFKNAKLSTPPGCAEFGLAYDDYFPGDDPKNPEPEHDVEFTGGKASADDGHYSGINMETFTTTRMGEKAVTAIEFSCNGGGNYIYPSIGLYDEDLRLLDSIEVWDSVEVRGNSEDVSGFIPKPYFNSVSPMGQYLGIDLGGIGVYGDDGCTACEKSASADVLYRWDGKSFAHQDTVYQLPSGDVRTPARADVQKFAEAVAGGNDTEAARSSTSEMMSSLDDVLGDGQTSKPPTVRSEQFPKGVKVDTCELVQPYEGGEYGTEDYYFTNGETMPGLYSQYGIEAGDTVCGVTTPEIDGGDSYYLYLLLKGTPDGSVKVYEAGRHFS